MADPFLAQYAAVFNDSLAFDDVVLQVKTIQKHNIDPKTGLNFHGWDESKEQKWANPETGCSPNFWGRSVGWYSMALVDILDYLPENHPGRPEIITILDNLLNSLINFQDKETGLWYQVLDQGGREGNYLEATASSMFVYSMTKAVNKGYVNPELLKVAQKGFDGIIAKLIKENEDGTIC
jgi:unsaturated rhamnogalacturonyl hydrolase